MKNLLAMLVCCVLIFGCAHTSVTEHPGENLPMPAYNPVLMGDKAANLVVGSKFIFKKTNTITGQSTNIVLIVKNKINWEGKIPVYVIDTGTGFIVWDTNLNTVAILDPTGRLVTLFNPPVQLYKWPLRTGKAWGTNYEVTNKDKKESTPDKVVDSVQVSGKGTITIPDIGSFSIYIIKRDSGNMTETHYYSPDFGMEVKQDINFSIDSPEGFGMYSIDLVGYSIPGVGEKGFDTTKDKKKK